MSITDEELIASLPAQRLQLAAGTMLFQQGDPAQHVVYLERGQVRLLRHLEDGQALTMHAAVGPCFFAEAALFAEVYHCAAVADSVSEVHLIDKTVLAEHLACAPVLALSFLERVTRQLHRARTIAQLRSIRSAEERVLQHLRLSLPEGARCITFPLPLIYIATELGLTHEAYYRALAKLARAGTIRRDGRTIELA